MIKFLGFLILSIAVHGCAFVGNEIDPNYVKKIEIGETTENELLDNLGKPYGEKKLSDGGKVFSYIDIRTSLSSSFLNYDMYKPVAENSHAFKHKSRILTLVLDPNGVVKKMTYSSQF